MRGLPFDFKKALLVLFIIALPLISVNVRREGQPALYEKPLHFISAQLQSIFIGYVELIQETTSTYIDLVHSKKRLSELEQEKHQLQLQLMQLDELNRENLRLSRLLGFKEKHAMILVAAKVVGIDLLGEHSSIRLDKGLLDGLQKGQGVIINDGVVGYLWNVSNHSSVALLITDRYSIVDAIDLRSRVRGLIEGKTQDSCNLKYLKRSDDVQANDLIVTSGLDNIFPKGFAIGRVVKVEKKNVGISQNVTVEPVVNSSQLEEVFVIQNAAHVDFLAQEEKERADKSLAQEEKIQTERNQSTKSKRDSGRESSKSR